MYKEIISVQGLCEFIFYYFFFGTLKFTSILTKYTELMSCSSDEFETFRSKNNTERRHIVCYFIIPSLGLSTYLLCSSIPHHGICVRLAPAWALIDRLPSSFVWVC